MLRIKWFSSSLIVALFLVCPLFFNKVTPVYAVATGSVTGPTSNYMEMEIGKNYTFTATVNNSVFGSDYQILIYKVGDPVDTRRGLGSGMAGTSGTITFNESGGPLASGSYIFYLHEVLSGTDISQIGPYTAYTPTTGSFTVLPPEPFPITRNFTVTGVVSNGRARECYSLEMLYTPLTGSPVRTSLGSCFGGTGTVPVSRTVNVSGVGTYVFYLRMAPEYVDALHVAKDIATSATRTTYDNPDLIPVQVGGCYRSIGGSNSQFEVVGTAYQKNIGSKAPPKKNQVKITVGCNSVPYKSIIPGLVDMMAPDQLGPLVRDYVFTDAGLSRTNCLGQNETSKFYITAVVNTSENGYVPVAEGNTGNNSSTATALGRCQVQVTSTPTPTGGQPTGTGTVTPTGSACPRGNLGNLDCTTTGGIDASDLDLLLSSWGTPAPTPVSGFHSANLDGVDGIDASDLDILLTNWGLGA